MLLFCGGVGVMVDGSWGCVGVFDNICMGSGK